MKARSARMTATAAAPIPMPASAPVERPPLLSLLLVDEGDDEVMTEMASVGVAEADAGTEVDALLLSLLLVALCAESRLRILVFAEFHRTCITSAKTVLLLISAFLMVVSGGFVGMEPGPRVEVTKTFVRSLFIRLAQALRTPLLVV